VLALPERRVGAKLVNLYREDTTPAEATQHKELLKQTKEYYRKKGSGRPTKKDRREIDDFLTDDE
jgi:ribosome-associated heat shock protein Hsp15